MIRRDTDIASALQSRQRQRALINGRGPRMSDFIINSYGGAGGNPSGDPYWADVVALLPMNGANGSTTFTDQTGKTWTASGNAQISTAQSVYGGSSGRFDGTGDFISSSVSADFGFGTGNFTIEGWTRQASNSSDYCIFDNRSASNQGIGVYVSGSSANYPMRLAASNNSSYMGGASTTPFAANAWQHWSVTRIGTSLLGHIGGLYLWGATDSRTYASSATPFIGANYIGTQGFNGYCGWVRVTKAARYAASNYSTPTIPYPNY